MDAFDDPPIEVIGGHVQVHDLFNVVLWAAAGVFLSVHAGEFGEPLVIVVFALLFFVLSGVWLVTSWSSRIEVHRAGLVRRYRLRTYRYPWERIDKVVLGPGHRVFDPRPSPILVLSSGRRVELAELRTPLWVPLSGVTTSAESRELTQAIELRIDHPDAPEVVEPVTGSSAPPRAVVVVPLLACLSFFVAALAVAMLVVPFIGTTADVDPVTLPPGRVYYGATDPQTGTNYWVECPRPVASAFGDDPICRREGRDALRNSVVGLLFCVVSGGLLFWYVRSLRRRYQRWNEVTTALNA